MEKNEIKKALYKQKPIAHLDKIRLSVAYYVTSIDKGLNSERDVEFQIPIEDMGDADFEPTMEAKFLIRWIV